MSAIPIPQPRTSGGRPPFEPPRTTTFDSSPGDNPEPMHKVLSDSVRILMKHVGQCEEDKLWIMLRLVKERKELIEGELRFERMISPEPMPPLLKNLYSLEFLFEENEAVRTYNRLLDTLDEAEQSILAKMLDQNGDAPASDL
jgi:hypothetical protein